MLRRYWGYFSCWNRRTPYLAVAAFPRHHATAEAGQLDELAASHLGVGSYRNGRVVGDGGVQLGINGAVSIAAISALIVSVLALRRLPASRLGQHAVKVAFVLGLAALFVGEFSTPPSAPSSASAAEWEWFDEIAIARYVASEKTVFVDVTADWCLTCQVNKKLVLDTAPVADWLTDECDTNAGRWTRPNPPFHLPGAFWPLRHSV